MNLVYENKTVGATLLLTKLEAGFRRDFFTHDREQKYLTIAWNRGRQQEIIVDEITYDFPANSVLPLMVNQSFRFTQAADVVVWQFNREFYCIVDHDQEVGCAGFLFFGLSPTLFVQLDEKNTRKLGLLLEIFKDEFETADNIQGEMLRLLLVRLIITITRLARQQQLDAQVAADVRHDLVRHFNLLVENHYRAQHEVKFYAAQLNKSPKTLANVFALYSQKTPLQIIQDRLVLEAKRLFYYTDKTSKEIAFDLGFEDAAHFSRWFKNLTQANPTAFKAAIKFSP